MDTCCKENYPDHSKELRRLNRILGQVEGIKKMITERRYCPDIMIQLKAVQSATKSIEANILQRHLKGCVTKILAGDNTKEAEIKIEELIQLFKKSK